MPNYIYPLFCKHALRSSLEYEIGTAVEPFREKNNNVNLPVIKSIRECIICLFSLSKYLFSAAILSSVKCFQCLLAQRLVSSANGSFVFLNIAPNPCARLDG